MKLAIVIVTTVIAVLAAMVGVTMFLSLVVGIPPRGVGNFAYFSSGAVIGWFGLSAGTAWYDTWRDY